MQLEELGFCGRGEAKDFATVENLSLGGRLPINTSGGLLGEAYIHGMNGITEAVRQIRGTSVQPGARRRARARDGGHGVPDERADPGTGVAERDVVLHGVSQARLQGRPGAGTRTRVGYAALAMRCDVDASSILPACRRAAGRTTC